VGDNGEITNMLNISHRMYQQAREKSCGIVAKKDLSLTIKVIKGD